MKNAPSTYFLFTGKFIAGLVIGTFLGMWISGRNREDREDKENV